MESLSRPPHRRKHSSATSVFSTSSSLKNPYDDVLLSKGASKKKAFRAHEYAEIFSGSSSIPVLDLPGQDVRVGSVHTRSNGKLDYSNIFGGVRNDDVAVPYEELLNGSIKKTKQRAPAEARPPLQDSSSLNSSGNTKKSSEGGSDKSADELEHQQFNISFNKTSQRNSDTSSGKTHVAQLHFVPGFTYFVDGAAQPQRTTEHDRPVSSLKHEVSRTWSFSAEVEAIKGKGVPSNWEKSQSANGINLKSHPSKVQPPSVSPTNLSDNNVVQLRSKVSSFVSKEDASGRIAGDYSPPLLDDELDENSVAGLSAAALKKALDQAEETIRIAKMIMEGKREGFHDGRKSKSKGCSKVKDKKKNRIHHDALYGSEEKIIDAAKELGEASVGVDKQFAESCSQSETLDNYEKVTLEKKGERVEVRKEATDISGLVASAERKAANLVSGLVDNIKSLMLSRNKQPLEEMETGKKAVEHVEVTLHHTEGNEVVSEMAEMAPDNSRRMHELEKSATETLENCQGTVDHSTESENVTEMVEEVKIVNGEGKNLRNGHENEVIEDKEDSTDHEKTQDDKLQQTEEIVNPQNVMELTSDLKNMLNESRNLLEKEVEQEDMKDKSENVKQDGHEKGKSFDEDDNLKRQTEDHQLFQSYDQLNEDSGEIVNESEPSVCSEFDEVGTKVNGTHDAEIDGKKKNNFPEELELIEGTRMNSFQYEAAETVEMKASNRAEVRESEEFQDAAEISNSPLSSQESSNEKGVDEAVDGRRSDVSTIFCEIREAHDLDLNRAEVSETFCELGEDKDAEQLSDLGDLEMPETVRLRKSASEQIISGSKSHIAEGLSSDGEKAEEGSSSDGERENFGTRDAEFKENLQNDQDTFETTGEIRDGTEEHVTRIDWQNLPDFHPSESETADFGQTDVREALEQTLESDEESLSTSSLENIQEHAENAKDNNSNDDGAKDDVKMNFNERTCIEQQSEAVNSQLYNENDMEKSTETERDAKADQNIEKNKENLSVTSTVKEKENVQNFDKDDDYQQRIEAIKRGREREKDRKFVERAIRIARERAFAEARERAERAAVERAAAEARQRAMAEAREKASVATKQSVDKASMEAKIRAERAAVERATAEARGRALEKARSQNSFTETSSSRNNGLKHSFSSPDLEKSDGVNTESAQRRKARLERHQRIMERAAKALEEKNMRDLVVQKEQAERNRLAESLDADIKRWAAGKEGNLRALLSTLQYILGPDSGWQAISLTEMIATAAVKKAYRKATLYVHPDKLQQRGASIRQKYICEKVFDLLKAAWNRFNSEER